MKLRTRIFVVSFAVSVFLLGLAGFFILGLDGKESGQPLAELEKSVQILSLAAQTASQAENPAGDSAQSAALDPALVLESLEPLKRDIARRLVLEKDRSIDIAITLILFFAAEALAALIVAFIASRLLTRRWTNLQEGILALRQKGVAKQFFTGLRDEFGLVEEELDRLVAVLHERERMRSELKELQGWGEASAFLAHQARTPLASMELSARTALETLSASTKELSPESLATARTAISMAQSEALRVASLFARVRSMSGFKDPLLERFDPEDVIMQAATRLALKNPEIQSERIRVLKKGMGPVPRLDKGYIIEAFGNLLQNSFEACVAGGHPFSALVTLTADVGMYSIEYSDSVTGLDPSLLDKIGTTRFTSKADGAGLGVWLVDRIAALHGGMLRIEMTEIGGLRFTITFPVEGTS
jgi:signal transduction histidine kinase